MLAISGPVAKSVGNLIGAGDVAVTLWTILRWPVILVLVAAGVAILYYIAPPNVRQPKFRWISVGAGLAIVVWILASVLFGVYVANFSSYNKTYGTLAGGVIVFLLWLWITNVALLFGGAELDAELERGGRQLQAGLHAERDLQLPPRDTKKMVEKNEAKEQALIEEGRKLRRSRGGRSD